MVQFASRMDLLKGSEIRELLKLTAQPDILSFAGGMPAPELFPVEQMMEASIAVLKEHGREALQYSTTEGFPRLREQIAERMLAKNNIHTDKDHILVTSGSQQGLDFSARVFLNPGDVVLLESPSYLGAVNAFKACEPKFIEVPTDDGGMIMDELEKILATTERVKMIYVIPDFQNPTGRTWDLDRRHKFMEIINRYEIPVIEDNPYGELRFEGEYMPALKSLDTKGLVIYLGTFSKILAPGYRLGWVCAEDEILAKYNFMEQAASLQASTIGQMETSKWIDMFDLDAHVNTIRECYRKRRAVMLETLAKELPEPCTFTRPDGGLFAWVVLPEYMDAKDLQMKCLAKKVAFVPGGSFFPNGGHDNTLRLNYSCMPEEKIVKGITALCQTIRENLRKQSRYKETTHPMKHVKVLIGNYGSGKSELALNFAMQAAARGDRTELLDLDMVNTYFRLTERGKLVEQKEIRLVSPNFACSGIETLSLPAEVSSAFVLDWDTVIFDVGGDDVGATALGRYHQDFVDLAPGALEVLNVVNIRRPLAGTVEKLLRLQEGMQTHARLQITGMINNTNLATATTEQDLWDGYQMLREVSDLTGIPVSYTTGKKEFLDAFLARNPDPKYVGQPIPIDVYMHRDWDSYIEYGLNTKNPHKDMY